MSAEVRFSRFRLTRFGWIVVLSVGWAVALCLAASFL